MSPRKHALPITEDPTQRVSCALPGEITTRGAQAHAYYGERPCEACRLAKNAYRRAYYVQGPLRYGPNVLKVNAREYRGALRQAWTAGYAAAKLGKRHDANPYDTAEVTG